MHKRIFAFVLAFLMLFTSMPLEAFATAGNEGIVTGETLEGNQINLDPTEAAPQQTEPRVTEPQVTEPKVTEPQVTEPQVTEPQVTEPQVTEPQVTEPQVTEPQVTEPQVTEPQVTEPQVTEPQVTEPEETEPETPKYNLGWEYAAITLGGIGYEFTDPSENHYGSALTVAVNGVTLSEGALLEGILAEGVTGTMTITAAEGYTFDGVVLASINGAPFTTAADWAEDARGFMTEDSTESRAVLSLEEIYGYMMEGDAPNVYIMVQLIAPEGTDNPDAAENLAPGDWWNPGWGETVYGSNLGWEYSNISAQGGGFYLSDPAGTSAYLGDKVTVKINGDVVAEGTSGLKQNVLSRNNTGIVNVSAAYGYYIDQIVLACYLSNYNDGTGRRAPFNCRTVAGDDAYEYALGSSTPTSVNISLGDIYSHANHESNVYDYYLMIKVAPIPGTVYVGYDAGSINGTAISARPVAETSISGATQVSSHPTWGYTTTGLSAAPNHSALRINPEAEAEANAKGYSFAGWKLEYYTDYSASSNAFSGTMSVGGTNLPYGTNVPLHLNAKLTAIWQPLLKIQVQKEWVDNNDQDGLRPDDLTVHLLRNSSHFGTAVTLNAGNNWTGSWNAPQLDENGNTITYHVEEVTPTGYTPKVESLGADDTYTYRFKITNTHTPEITAIQAHKVWADDNDRDGKRPDSVTLELYANGVAVSGSTKELNEENKWSVQWENMTKYSGGEEIEYTVKEVTVPDSYEVSYSVDEDDQSLVVTNTLKMETTSITATKIWNDDGDRDGKRPDSVTLEIYADGEATGQTVEVTPDAAGNWTKEISGLPKYRSGRVEIVYSLVETDLPEGYTSVTNGTTVTNTYTPETISIPVTKKWEDNEDQDGLRPDSITVNLYADGVKVASMPLSAATNWAGTFDGVPKYRDGRIEIVYTVDEDAVTGYTAEVDGTTITNTHEPAKGTLHVKKVWDDFDDNDRKRPYAVVVALAENGKPTTNTVVLAGSAEAQADGLKLEGTWSGVDLYRNGLRINYTVEEIGYYADKAAYASNTVTYDDLEDYTAKPTYDITDPDDPKATITNTYSPETIGINVQKSWNDSDNQDGVRPASVTMKLLYSLDDGATWTDTGRTQVLTAQGENKEWDATFTDLPKYSDGTLIKYKVEEIVEAAWDEYYSVEYKDPTAAGVCVVINTHTPAETAITVRKVWDDRDNQDGKRPDSVTVSLYGYNKTTALDTQTLNAGNGWSYTWKNLPQNYAGSPIIYTAVEQAVPGYNLDASGVAQPVTGSITETSPTEITLTNSRVTETVSVPFRKIWEDNNDQDGIRPDSITVNLYADGTKVASKPLSAATNWSGSFDNLDKNKNGTAITYTVDEEPVSGYTKNISGTTITNTHTPETVTIPVSKKWEDNENQDGIRPQTVTVVLYGDNVEVDRLTLSAENGWSGSFDPQPKFAGGVLINYTFKEVGVAEGYTASIDGSEITNTHVPATTSVTVHKVWNDSDNQDGKRPGHVTVNLLANGVVTKTQTFSATNEWSYTFTDLPVYENGTAIRYTVTEEAVAGYTTQIDGFTVTNSYTPETISVPVSKVWDDNNNQDGLRPASITVDLYANNVKIDDEVLSAENGWKSSFNDLPKYANGVEIIYTVAEAEVPEGYTAGVQGGVITNTHTPATTSIPVSKVWDDESDQDGKRPEFVTVNLLANGVEIQEVVLGTANLWQHTFVDLPVNQNGNPIAYTLTEDPVAEYTTSIDQTTGVITNTHVPLTVTVTANKIWVDNDENDDTRPDFIELHLLASGEHKYDAPQVVTPDENGNWSHTWTDLPMYNDGQLIRYTVTENDVFSKKDSTVKYSASYDVTRSEDQKTVTATITNKLDPLKTAVTVEKLWDDTYNQDGLRPKTIRVRLYADNVATDKVLDLSMDHGWIGTFTDLDKNKDGAAIAYTAREIGWTDTNNVYREGLVYGENSVVYTTDHETHNLEVTNKHTAASTSISVVKDWQDNNNQDGIRPEEITITLFRNGTSYRTAQLSEDNNWSYTFSDLPVNHGIGVPNVYYLEESGVPAGYVSTEPEKNSEGVYVITNTHTPETVSIPVSKEWDDNNNQDGKRPEKITVQVKQGDTVLRTMELNANNNWSGSFDGLPKYEQGTAIVYTLAELPVPGYSTTIDQAKGIIRNSYTPETTSVTASKIWDDANNQDGKRPASVTLHLLADGEHTGRKITLTARHLDADGSWSFTWNSLPKYADGKVITYAIQEDTVTGYATKIEYNQGLGKFVITNTYAPEKTSVGVWKQWNDNHDQDGLRPQSITVELLADGVSTGRTKVLTEDKHWMDTFADLPKYANGNLISYTVKEMSIPNYEQTKVTSEANGFVITNTHTTATTSVTATKIWNDNNNQDGIRPTSVVLRVYADGVATDRTVTVTPNEKGEWTAVVTGLPKYHNKGKQIVYHMVEENVPEGYTSVSEGLTVVNTHVPETVSVPVAKLWDDNENQDGIRPKEVKVQLYQRITGSDAWTYTEKSIDLKVETNWKGAFTDLPKKSDGKLIEYKVEEAAITGYELVSTVTEDGVTIFTNKHTPETADLNVKKVWDDFGNNDGFRTEAVEVTLYENGQPTDSVLKLEEKNQWTGVWEDMPRFRHGQRISYSVVETAYYKNGVRTAGVPVGYTVTHDYITTDLNNPTAIVTNSYTPAATSLNVQKIWDDDDNRDGKRPESVTVKLYQDILGNDNWVAAGRTAVMNAENEWEATFEDLPKYYQGNLIKYKAEEEPVANYNAPVYSNPTDAGIMTITNSRDVGKVFVSVRKEWYDQNNQDGLRPKEIEVTLYANGIKLTSAGTTVKLNAANNWTHTWKGENDEGLYEYYKGKKIVYTVAETSVPEGYTAAVTTAADAQGNVTVTLKNTHETAKTTVSASKVWNDANDQDRIRPTEVTVHLLADGVDKGESFERVLNAANNWSCTWTNLEKNANGKPVAYTVVEEAVTGYTAAVTGDMTTGFTITNTHQVEKTELTVVKVWDDGNDQDGKRPESIKVHLLSDGEHTQKYVEIKAAQDGTWSHTWTGLDKYAAGKEIIYTVYEEPVQFKAAAAAENMPMPVAADSYTASYYRNSATKVTITNSYTPENTDITAIKVWDDGNNRDALRTESVTVRLLADGKDTGKTLVLNAGNDWEGIWTKLPKYSQGKLIAYSVEEVNVPTGYVCTVAPDEEFDPNTHILTNTHAPATTGVTVSKIWNDEDNNDGKRPDGIIVQLCADGTPVEGARAILSGDNSWVYTWETSANIPLYVYHNGVLIKYSVEEVGYVIDGVEYQGLPEGYVGSTAAGGNGYSIAITNTRASEKTSVTVNKVWDDQDNNDGIRPTSVQVTLVKNGVDVETVTLNDTNKWTHSWTDLYKYAGGEEIAYTVREVAVSGYTAGYSYTTAGNAITATVTNSHTSTLKQYTIQKYWIDNKNAEGLRSDSVSVQLYKDGEAYGDPIALSEKNSWKVSVGLPVYENGAKIEWTIKELNIPKYYSASYLQSSLSVINTIQSRLVPKTGDYNNLWKWFLLLGICGAGAGSVVVYDKKKKRSKD